MNPMPAWGGDGDYDAEKGKPLKEKDFWKNPIHTRGYAACDACEGGNPMSTWPHDTWQNGKITLCEYHYRKIVLQEED